ncbi:CPBP family intramembrane glutamic endopeptidase [Candidatus Clostridium stratigraminis]|uniref:CPBP family intramembrane glutamic endopeptidase n=1 Tax=Candidatus Clostridium stratigraminis TaxID=3381661 RepID=A0ABW8T4M6_9CLOT
MDKRTTINYLIVTFLSTYILWGLIIVSCQIGYFQFGSPIAKILFTIGGNAPPIAAYAVLKKAHIITGIKQFAKEAFAIKQKPQYYCIMIVFLIIYFGIPALLQGVSIGSKLYVSFFSIPIIIFYGGLEELGWRYILQPSLEKQFPFGIATSLTACTWAVWHLPLFFIKGTANSNLNFGLFTIMVFGMSFALATIYYKSKSIWLCILFHTMVNTLSSSWVIKESIVIQTCTTILMIAFSFAIITYHKKKRDSYIENEYNLQS